VERVISMGGLGLRSLLLLDQVVQQLGSSGSRTFVEQLAERMLLGD